MANKTNDVITYNDTEYDITDRGDVIELFNDLIYTIEYLRCEVRDLRNDFNYMSSHCVYRYNSEED